MFRLLDRFAPWTSIASILMVPASVCAGCDTTAPPPPIDDPKAEPSASPTKVAARPTSLPTRPTAAPAYGDDALKVGLTSGATLTIPPPVRVRANTSATKRLPDIVKQAQVYELGSDKRLLMINELEMKGKSCDTLIAEQQTKMKAAEADHDEQRLQFRRQKSSEVVEVDGHDVLFGQAQHKGVSAADDKPFVGSASAIMCRDGHYLLLMFMARTEEKPGAPRQILMDVIKSFSKK